MSHLAYSGSGMGNLTHGGSTVSNHDYGESIAADLVHSYV